MNSRDQELWTLTQQLQLLKLKQHLQGATSYGYQLKEEKSLGLVWSFTLSWLHAMCDNSTAYVD